MFTFLLVVLPGTVAAVLVAVLVSVMDTDESHEDSAMLAQLREAARQWEARGRPVGLLWTGDAVEEARRWRRRSNAVLTPLEDAFLTAAFRLADRAVRRKRLLLVIAVSAMALVTVGALIALLAIT